MNKWILLGLLAFLANAERIKYYETLALPQLAKFSKRDGSFSVAFKAHDREFELELERHTTLFSDDVVFEYEAAGQVHKHDFDTTMYYKGKAKMGSDEGTVSVRFDDETQSIHGLLIGEHENWMIESSADHGSHNDPMVIYKWSDVEDQKEHSCGVTAEHEHKENYTMPSTIQRLRNAHSQSLRQAASTCTMALVADSRWFRALGSNTFNAVKRMMDVMVNVEAIYRADNLGGFQIAATRVHTDANSDPYRDVANNAGNFLNKIHDNRGNTGPGNKCLTHGFTHEEWNGPVGLAFVGHTCIQGGGSGVTTSFAGNGNPPNGVRFLTIVVAHEIGHNFGSNHDSANVVNMIMSPAVGANQQRKFSQDSKNQFNARKNSGGFNCFVNKPASLGGCGNGIIDAGEQCDCGTTCNTDNFCTAQCTLKNGAACTPTNGPCCGGNGQKIARGTNCGPVPLPGIAAPTCNGVSTECPNCWPAETHPNIYSNIKPCNIGRDCKAGCAWDNNPNQCVTCKGIGSITEENLPDDSCCSNGGRCRGGVCIAQTPAPPAPNPPPAPTPPTPSPPTPSPPAGNCANPTAAGTGTGLIGRYFRGQNFQTLVSQRTDPVVAFDWNVQAPPGTNLPADQFSIRWGGHVEVRFAGQWNFFTIADDGTRLWVGGVQIINDFIPHSRAQRSGAVILQAGARYTIKLEYFEGFADASVQLQWSHACVQQQNIPASQLYPVSIAGLDTDIDPCEPYEGEGTGLTVQRLDVNGTKISEDLDEIIDEHIMGVPAGFGDRINIVWTGFIQARFSEQYTFYTTSASGVRLTVDGQLIINNWNQHAITENNGNITLAAGRGYPIKVEFWHAGPNDSEGVLQLSWETPKCQAKEIIQKPYFYQSLDLIPTSETGVDQDPIGDNSAASSLFVLASFVLYFLF